VTLAYFVFLKRDPEPDGHKYWSNILDQNPNGEKEVIMGFVNSVEYRGRNVAR
jgi:hypothetical protein